MQALNSAARGDVKLRVGFFFTDFSFIGAQRMSAAVIRHLDRSRFEPIVFALQKKGPLINEFPGDIRIVQVDDYSPLARAPRLRVLAYPLAVARAIRRVPIDVAVSHTPITNMYLLLARRFLMRRALPLIIEEHQHLSTSLKFDAQSWPRMLRFAYLALLPLYNSTTLFRCISEASRRDFVENWKIKRSITEVLPPLVDVERIDADGQATFEHPWFDGKFPLVMGLGRLTAQKNFGLLIRAFARVRKDRVARLMIIGDGPEKVNLSRMVAKLSLENDVCLAGFVPNARSGLKKSQVFVLSSVWEGMPAVICEAMRLGVPVVAVDCPSGPGEMIRPDQSGILVPANNERALAQGILRVLDNPELAERLRRGGHEDVMKYSTEMIMPKFEFMIEEAALKGRGK